MTDYSKMSDFEINKSLAEHEGVRGFHCENIGDASALRFQNWKELDYCNNPADAWPIIAENKINIDFRDSIKAGPMARLCRDNGIYAVDKNPLRAAMIVFLMMKDAEKC
ncbi:phage protein NinX family protein [Serratia sp. CY49633]|uniref:phage protein NinX family protein n=1 Tax=Serratia sp. CY49633 TaxID=3383629 RepID=UPI003F9F7FE0